MQDSGGRPRCRQWAVRGRGTWTKLPPFRGQYNCQILLLALAPLLPPVLLHPRFPAPCFPASLHPFIPLPCNPAFLFPCTPHPASLHPSTPLLCTPVPLLSSFPAPCTPLPCTPAFLLPCTPSPRFPAPLLPCTLHPASLHPCIPAFLLLRTPPFTLLPCTSASLISCTPSPHFHAPLYPCFLASLHPSTPAFLHPCFPASLYPFTPIPYTPASLHPSPHFPAYLLSCFPAHFPAALHPTSLHLCTPASLLSCLPGCVLLGCSALDPGHTEHCVSSCTCNRGLCHVAKEILSWKLGGMGTPSAAPLLPALTILLTALQTPSALWQVEATGGAMFSQPCL